MDQKLKYPMQVGAIVRTKKTFSVDSAMTLPTDGEYKSSSKMPLEMHSVFSRFKLTIIDFESGDKKIATANLPAGVIAYILKETEIAMERMELEKAKSTGLPSSPAFTQKLFSKEYNGLTPGEWLLRNPSGIDALEKTKNWLSANLSKYPKNKTQIEAIDDALTLIKAGKLKAPEGNACESTFCVYKDDIKIPNVSKVDDDGYTRVYNISIQCTPGRNYPFAINIMNCRAKPINDGSGQSKVELSSAKDKVTNSIMLSTQEWFFLIHRMNRTVNMFEDTNFEKQLKIAIQNSYKFGE